MIKRVLFVGICMVFFISATFLTARPKIYVIGDSTAASYNSTVYPLTGWAQVLQGYFNIDSTLVADSARSGCSSKSFYTEGRWTPVKNELKKGDIVIIEFGHNDEKNDSKSTNAQTTFKQYLSIYINDAISKGAIPILATPIERNYWNRDNMTLQETHVTSDSGDFPKAIRELAAAKNIDLVDMAALTRTYFEKIGRDSTNKLFLILKKGQYANYADGKTDYTHLQKRGAETIAQIFVNDVLKQKIFPLYTWIKGSAPTANKTVSSKKKVSTGKYTFVKNNTVFINENQNVQSFTLYDLHGRILNHQKVLFTSGAIPLNDKNGNSLSNGNYVFQYRMFDGSTKVLQVNKR